MFSKCVKAITRGVQSHDIITVSWLWGIFGRGDRATANLGIAVLNEQNEVRSHTDGVDGLWLVHQGKYKPGDSGDMRPHTKFILKRGGWLM